MKGTGKDRKNEDSKNLIVPQKNTQGAHSAEHSATIVLLTPRLIESQQLTLEEDGTIEIETFTLEIGESTKSTVSLRVCRGKSVVNLHDPSKTYRRAPSKIVQQSDSPVALLHTGTVVTFVQESPQDKIFPTLHSHPPLENLKPELDFYAPGQTLEGILNKIQKLKSKIIQLTQSLQQTRNALKSTRTCTTSNNSALQGPNLVPNELPLYFSDNTIPNAKTPRSPMADEVEETQNSLKEPP